MELADIPPFDNDRQTRVNQRKFSGGRTEGTGLVHWIRVNELKQKSSYRTQLQKGSPSASLYKGRVTGPVQVFFKIFDLWKLSKKEGAVLLGLENTVHFYNYRSGAKSLSNRDTKDRIRYLFQIHDGLFSLFQDEEAERAWIYGGKQDLEGKSPLEIMLEGSMENILLIKQYVEWISGR